MIGGASGLPPRLALEAEPVPVPHGRNRRARRGERHGGFVSACRRARLARRGLPPRPGRDPARGRGRRTSNPTWVRTPGGSLSRRGSPRRGRRSSGRHGSWVTITRARFSSLARPRKSPAPGGPESESRLPVGSSARIKGAVPARARAIATRCFCPPERSRGRKFLRVREPHRLEHPLGLAPGPATRQPRKFRAWTTFSMAVSEGNRLYCWKTKPIDRRRIFQSRPGRQDRRRDPRCSGGPRRPRAGSPECRARSSCPTPRDLPVATTSPRASDSETPRSTCTSCGPRGRSS